MTESALHALSQPETEITDPLYELLRQSARDLIANPQALRGQYPQGDGLPGQGSCAELLAFYDFPAEHWAHVRTTNPIEPTFATVRLRTSARATACSRQTTLAMVFKLLEWAQKSWRRIRGFRKLELVANNIEFRNGEQAIDQSDRNAACRLYTRFDINSAECSRMFMGGPLGRACREPHRVAIEDSSSGKLHHLEHHI